MSERAMIVVGAGSSARFGEDKLMVDVAGRPLVAHTVAAVKESVDVCVLVCRPDQVETLSSIGLGVEVVVGGTTRTLSEMAGLVAMGEVPALIGIHDGARPLVSPHLIERLFERASEMGGAVPVIEPDAFLLERRTHQPLLNPVTAQTPQVFRGSALMAAHVRAAQAGFDGHDTTEIVHRFGDLDIAAVPGDPGNLKVTYPEDLNKVRKRLADLSRNEPR